MGRQGDFVPARKHTAVELAVVRDHEHDFPFEDVVGDEATTYTRDVLVALHLFELAAQEPGGC